MRLRRSASALEQTATSHGEISLEMNSTTAPRLALVNAGFKLYPCTGGRSCRLVLLQGTSRRPCVQLMALLRCQRPFSDIDLSTSPGSWKVAWSGCPSLGPSDPGGWKKPKVGGASQRKTVQSVSYQWLD